ncbi:putative aldouronate transport system substrate-binding protein [Paenibacillus cellulosilyticus]|uniref:Putative aldouronate transport system substrate-binding protein n=1 Tax=Paenibacillus cellulosilyticus TaxID=375489 RepID=A0A2V2YSF5_9BACL|nr:ABC transporter substrate-binding protein [Paenibacillus cellulosilyticus]PWV99683.1 putative aldouronate transport system substrate-binding protein [Paenibacillus cellulosilyticus]QKS44881.1 extracellular solute-binding protein [Paenibacillus cellulosilyticus]
MKWNSTKTLSVLTLSSILLLSGCGGGNNDNSSSTSSPTTSTSDTSSSTSSPTTSTSDTSSSSDNTSSPSDSADSTKMDTSPIAFSFFGADISPNWNNMQDDVGKAITAATGVTINAEFDVGGGGGEDKISLMAASDQYPDIIFSKGNLGKLVDAGAIIDLTDLIDKYAPHIKEIMKDSMNRMKYSLDDQAIYAIPTNGGVNNESFDATGGFQVQLRVLKELGYPQIKTVQDYENVLKEYVAKHPTTDGQPTIPLLLNGDGWKRMITVTNPAFIATGAPDDGEYYVNPETYEAQLHYYRPEEKEYFRWLNHMYNEGLLDKNSFVQKDDQYQAKIASGAVLGLISQEWEYGNAENSLKSAGKNDATYGHFPVTLSDQYQDHELVSAGVDFYGISITKACKDPVRAIQFLDWLASDEGQVLNNWGVEGKQYTLDASGKRVIPDDVNNAKVNDNANFSKSTGIGLYTAFAPHYGDGVKDSTGNYYTTNFPEQIIASYSDAEKEALAGYNATTWKDLWPKDLPVKEWGALYNMQVPTDGEYQVIYTKTQAIVDKDVPKVVLAKTEDFDKVYDEFIADLDNAGAKKMGEMYTALVKNRVKLFTGKDVQ